MPDVKGNVTNTYTSGDKVALEMAWDGTHTGPLVTPGGTIPASGKRQHTPGVMTLEVQAEKIRKSSNYFDMLTFSSADRGSAGAIPLDCSVCVLAPDIIRSWS
jgi:predicted ester cyclase